MYSPGVDPKTFQLPCNSPNHSVNIAVHIFLLKWYIFPKQVHICLYLFIYVHMRVYVCIDSSNPNQGAYGPHWSLCGLGARPCGQRCLLLAVHN